MPYLRPEVKATRDRLRQEFASRLSEAIRAAGLTQGEVVRLSGINQGNLSAMMNGKLGASTPRVAALAKALNIEPYDLMPVPEPAAPESAKAGAPKDEGGSEIIPRPTIAPPYSTGRRKRSEGLERYLAKVRQTSTIEMLDMFEEIDPLRLAGRVKDEGFWGRCHAWLREEVGVRDAEVAKAIEETEGKQERQGGGRGRTEDSAPMVRKRVSRG